MSIREHTGSASVCVCVCVCVYLSKISAASSTGVGVDEFQIRCCLPSLRCLFSAHSTRSGFTHHRATHSQTFRVRVLHKITAYWYPQFPLTRLRSEFRVTPRVHQTSDVLCRSCNISTKEIIIHTHPPLPPLSCLCFPDAERGPAKVNIFALGVV